MMTYNEINNIKYGKNNNDDVYLIYKTNLYKTVHNNIKKYVIINVDNNKLFFISWRLYFMLEHIKTLEEAKFNLSEYDNVFKLNKILVLGSDDIYNFEYFEIPKRIQPTERNLIHYEGANINIKYEILQ